MDTDNLTNEQFAEMVQTQCSPAAKRIAELEREHARLREQVELFRRDTRICADCDGVRKAQYDHALELLRRWADWARAYGHDIGILDDTRAFLLPEVEVMNAHGGDASTTL